MKRYFVLLVALTALAAIVAGSAVAGSPAKKVNGDIWFENNSYQEYGIPNPDGLGHWVFNAQEGSPAKGSMTYVDGYGSYTAQVADVHVDGQDATITAQVTSTTHPYAAVGAFATFTVHDVAEPGVGSDYFTADPNGRSIDLPTITAGNIQIHS